MIPRIAHFIWLGPANHPRAVEYEENRRSFTWLNPSWQVMYWTWSLVEEHFELGYVKDLSSTYTQADYIRLLILFKFGGLYLDQDIIAFEPLPVGCFHDERLNVPSLVGKTNDVNNCLMAVRPGFDLLQDFIREGRHRYETHYLGRAHRFVPCTWGPRMVCDMWYLHPGRFHIVQEDILFDHHSINSPATHRYKLFHRSLMGWRRSEDFDVL